MADVQGLCGLALFLVFVLCVQVCQDSWQTWREPIAEVNVNGKERQLCIGDWVHAITPDCRAIKCFECRSDQVKECADPFNPPQSKRSLLEKECEDATACRKSVIDTYKAPLVVRECYTPPKGNYSNYAPKDCKKFPHSHVCYCVPGRTPCNAAPGLTAGLTLFSALLSVFLLWK